MLTADAIKHFGTRHGIVRALGNRTKAAIYHWGDVVPLVAAQQLEQLTGGTLKVRPELYNASGRIVRQTEPPSTDAA